MNVKKIAGVLNEVFAEITGDLEGSPVLNPETG